METNIERIDGEWKVTFTHGGQTFTLDYSGTEQECLWYKDRLDECFKRAFTELSSSLISGYFSETDVEATIANRIRIIALNRKVTDKFKTGFKSGFYACMDYIKHKYS